MRQTIISLHAAEGNRDIIEAALREGPFEMQHEVDTQLLTMIREGEPEERQLEYVANRMNELIAREPAFIFVTCTNYIVLLDRIGLSANVPILKIDELLFQEIAQIHKPIKLLFSNEQTIAGTMARLTNYVKRPLDVEVVLIPHIFDLYIAGKKEAHDRELQRVLAEFSGNEEGKVLVVAQLSMAPAATAFSQASGVVVLTPLTGIQKII